MHINHRNPLTVCRKFPPCESCWRVSLPVQKAKSFFLPPPSKPGHGDVPWNQPIETPSRLCSWSESHKVVETEIVPAAVETIVVTSDFQEQQGQQDGGACSSGLFIVAFTSVVPSPDNPSSMVLSLVLDVYPSCVSVRDKLRHYMSLHHCLQQRRAESKGR